MQSSRALHYLVYFLAGVAIGDCGIGHGLLAPDGLLVRRWRWWTLGALALFALYVAILVGLGPGGPANGLPPLARQMIFGLGFVLCCGAISFAMLAVFRRFANARTPVLTSLSRNAYGIYLAALRLRHVAAICAVAGSAPGGRQGRRRAVCRARGKLDDDRRLAADSGRRQSDLGWLTERRTPCADAGLSLTRPRRGYRPARRRAALRRRPQ